MKFGLHFMPEAPPDGANIVRRWEEILVAAVTAEDAGFSTVSLPEHHMFPDGHLPSPWPALGALAALTHRLELCTAVHLLPFEHPIHVAEHAAMVDILSHGRMRLGVGLANFEPEFEFFGLQRQTQVSRFEEAVDLVQRAWAGEEIDHEGRHFKVKGKATPQPVGAQLWMGAMSEPGARRAGRYGVPWVTDPLHNLDVLSDWASHYRSAGEEHGTSDRLGIKLMRDAWIADSLEDVERDWWPYVRSDHWFYFREVPRFVADREPFLKNVTSESDFHFDRHRRNRMVVGDAEACIAEVRHFEEVLGMDTVILRLRMPEGPAFEKELECIRRFGSEVIPAFAERAQVG